MNRNRRFIIGFTVFIFIHALCLLAFAQEEERGAGVKLSEKRLALVIGNGNYQHTASLNNPVNDATDISNTLKELRFEVILGTNQSFAQMRKLIREFGAKLKQNGGVGLFYYAGHGIQVGGRNFLIPVDADIVTEVETEDVALDINSVLRQMDAAGNGLNIAILDACRNNPFARSWNRDIGAGGLAQINAPNGTFIAYATAPDTTASDGKGRNGLYTAELLKYLKQSNLKIEEAFKEVTKAVNRRSGGKQVPWVSSSLQVDFYFALSGKTTNTSTNNDSTIEVNFWDSIKNSNDPSDFKEYLDRYPNGRFAGIASRRFQALSKQPPSVPQTWTVDSSLFTFELKQCRLSGTKVFCDFTVTNNDKDKELWIGRMNTVLIDNFNNKVEATRVELANSSNNFLSASAKVFMITGTRTPARIIFENVSERADKAMLISISAGAENVKKFKIEYRNIPLKEF